MCESNVAHKQMNNNICEQNYLKTESFEHKCVRVCCNVITCEMWELYDMLCLNITQIYQMQLPQFKWNQWQQQVYQRSDINAILLWL